MRRATVSAFTLIELSIVLVIIGLLVGGVLTGQALIRASQLQAVTTEFRNYQTAVFTFQDKYRGMPGDMRSALRFWPALTGSTADGANIACYNSATPSTTTATCNGDGDGNITLTDGAYYPSEAYRFWQHLASAGLIAGRFTGVGGPADQYEDEIVGTNIPASRYPGGGWGIRIASIWGFDSVGGGWYAGYNNTMMIGAKVPSSFHSDFLFSAVDALNIDTKIDDGKPNRGAIQGTPNAFGGTDCVNVADNAYLATNQNIGCFLVFKL